MQKEVGNRLSGLRLLFLVELRLGKAGDAISFADLYLIKSARISNTVELHDKSYVRAVIDTVSFYDRFHGIARLHGNGDY